MSFRRSYRRQLVNLVFPTPAGRANATSTVLPPSLDRARTLRAL